MKAALALLIVCALQACGPGPLPRFANPPPVDAGSDDDAGEVDG